MSKLSEACYQKLMEASVPEEEAERLAADYLARGFEQISAKYRTIAGLPVGETGLSALRRTDPTRASRLEQRAAARLEYMRGPVASTEGNRVELDLRTFKAFKRCSLQPPFRRTGSE